MGHDFRCTARKSQGDDHRREKTKGEPLIHSCIASEVCMYVCMYVCLYVSHLMYVRMHVCIASDVCMDVCNIMYHIYTCTCMHVWMDDACMCILHLMLVCNYASYLVYIACVVGACLYASHLLYACVYKCMCCI